MLKKEFFVKVMLLLVGVTTTGLAYTEYWGNAEPIDWTTITYDGASFYDPVASDAEGYIIAVSRTNKPDTIQASVDFYAWAKIKGAFHGQGHSRYGDILLLELEGSSCFTGTKTTGQSGIKTGSGAWNGTAYWYNPADELIEEFACGGTWSGSFNYNPSPPESTIELEITWDEGIYDLEGGITIAMELISVDP